MGGKHNFRLVPSLFGVLVLSGASGAPRVPRGDVPVGGRTAPTCAVMSGPAYYAIDLVTTDRIPGSGLAFGTAQVSVPGAGPFSVALAPDGSYHYQLDITVDRMKKPREGVLVAWVATREIDHVQRIGPLDDGFHVSGTVSWNKFLVIVTLESTDDPMSERWKGPIALRGMSRSGMMHTMAGHGVFQQENCAAFGYDE